MKHTLGIIGGRPNHALYFIGSVGDDLVYLDPHKTQSIIDVEVDDNSYHCKDVMKMDLKYLDPSISLCFFCQTESDFDNWCQLVRKYLIQNEKQPLFELARERQPQWGVAQSVEVAQDAITVSTDSFANYDLGSPSVSLTADALQPLAGVDSCKEAFAVLDTERKTARADSSDEEFELLG